MTTATTRPTMELTPRALAVLRAVSAGRAELTASSEPDLFIDGYAFCDQQTARTLAHHGLIRIARPAGIGQRVPAVLTFAGNTAIGASSLGGAPRPRPDLDSGR